MLWLVSPLKSLEKIPPNHSLTRSRPVNTTREPVNTDSVTPLISVATPDALHPQLIVLQCIYTRCISAAASLRQVAWKPGGKSEACSFSAKAPRAKSAGTTFHSHNECGLWWKFDKTRSSFGNYWNNLRLCAPMPSVLVIHAYLNFIVRVCTMRQIQFPADEIPSTPMIHLTMYTSGV